MNLELNAAHNGDMDDLYFGNTISWRSCDELQVIYSIRVAMEEMPLQTQM